MKNLFLTGDQSDLFNKLMWITTMTRRTISFLCLFCLTIFAAGAIIDTTTPSVSERISKIESWKDSHQKDDDKQFAELSKIDTQLAAVAIDREHRLTLLENQYLALSTDLASLQLKLWGLLLGVVAQLIHMVYSMLSKKVSLKIEEESLKHRSH